MKMIPIDQNSKITDHEMIEVLPDGTGYIHHMKTNGRVNRNVSKQCTGLTKIKFNNFKLTEVVDPEEITYWSNSQEGYITGHKVERVFEYDGTYEVVEAGLPGWKWFYCNSIRIK